MNNFYFREVLQALKHLNSDLSQQVFVHAAEARLFDVLVKVAVEEFKDDNVMLAEVEAVK